MAMTRQRIGAAGGLNQNIRPKDARLDVDGGDLGDADAHVILGEPGAFAPGNRFVAHFDARREEEITSRPAAGAKDFCWHRLGFQTQSKPPANIAAGQTLRNRLQVVTEYSALLPLVKRGFGS